MTTKKLLSKGSVNLHLKRIYFTLRSITSTEKFWILASDRAALGFPEFFFLSDTVANYEIVLPNYGNASRDVHFPVTVRVA